MYHALIVNIKLPTPSLTLTVTLTPAPTGQKFTEPPPFDLVQCYADSSPEVPLIFVLTPGSDPTLTLLQFAGTKEKSLENGLVKAISLGQGQGPKAEVSLSLPRPVILPLPTPPCLPLPTPDHPCLKP